MNDKVPVVCSSALSVDEGQRAGTVEAVHLSPTHTFSKVKQLHIRLLVGLGVEGDAHAGLTVRHRSRVAKDPSQPNLRQVHLLHAELLEELRAQGFSVQAGDIGENITTRGLDLLTLPTGTRLHLGVKAMVEITGLRNPCVQLDAFQLGLKRAVLDHDDRGRLVRKAGVMSVVVVGGEAKLGDSILVELTPLPHRPLEVV